MKTDMTEDHQESIADKINSAGFNIEDLKHADMLDIINAYDKATRELQQTHATLRARVEYLTGELSLKNEHLTSSLEEVSALKNYLANILESITDGVIAIDPDRRVMAFNHSAAEVVLSIATDHMGQPIADVLPATCQELGKLLIRALVEERGFTNVQIILKGKVKRILSVSASPIRNEKGELLGAVQTFRDLTNIKNLEEKAARQERLAALGEMAAGVAHEIRNPLGGIELYASSLKRRFDGESKEAEIADKITAAAGALNRIVTDMLTFTRGREPVFKPASLESIFHMALDMAARELDKKNITVEKRLAIGKRKTNIDPDQISQACLNIILNAVQFMPEKGTLIISSFITAGPEGEEMILEFDDDGPGITDEQMAKLFNPFFTTRKDGTGLGLAIVHKIISGHGGTVSVENRPPRGACFIFRLPVR